jgi:predicted Zn-dependent protease with MMP-like domain
MQIEEFEKMVQEALEDIPDEYRKILRKEKIEILPRENAPQGVKEKFPNETVFGIFVGTSLKCKTVFSIPTEPTRIELYKESFEKVFGTKVSEAVKEQIRRSVIHEIAHYLGFSEGEIRKKGY